MSLVLESKRSPTVNLEGILWKLLAVSMAGHQARAQGEMGRSLTLVGLVTEDAVR